MSPAPTPHGAASVRSALAAARAIGALAAAGVLAACGDAANADLSIYEDVVFEALRHTERMEILAEPRRGRVRVESVTPLRAVQGGEGLRPSLVLPGGSRVLLDLPDAGEGTSLSLAVGATAETHERHRDGGYAGATLRVRLDDEPTAEIRVPVGGDLAQERRDWQQTSIPVPDGGLLELEVVARTGQLVELAAADLRLEKTVRVERADSSPEAPNLVLVVIDTLRSDRLSGYGYDRPTSPTLDALAARGVRWANAWSVAPWTWPSTASILTGVEPFAHGVLDVDSCYLPDSFTTLPEHARAAGLSTFGVSTNPLVGPGSNFDQGFERFELFPWERAPVALGPTLEFLEDVGDRRFLLYLHLTDPHLPYEPEPDLVERFVEHPMPEGFEFNALETPLEQLAEDDPLRVAGRLHASDLYDAEVAAADRAVGRVLEALERLDLDGRTLVVVTSDHGEELLEHGRLGHSHQLFRESLVVPLIAAGPGLPIGREPTAMVQNHRLLPSLLDWLDLPGDRELGAPLPLGTEESAAGPLFFSTEVGSWIGERGERRLLGSREGERFFLLSPEDGRRALYDTALDPDERVDLSDGRTEGLDPLQAELERWVERTSAARPAALAGGSATADMLRRLGYLDAR